MNDLYYIAYDAKRMFLDTSDMTCEGERAHRRLCDFIWYNDGPPLNNNESLRQLTHTRESDWARVKRELLAKGWIDAGEYLLHRGAIKSLNESKETYVANFNRTAKANGKTPLKLSEPDPQTGCVTIIETTHVTSDVTHNVTDDQSKSKSEPVPKVEVHLQNSQSAGREDVDVRKHLTKLTREKAKKQAFSDHILGSLGILTLPSCDRIARDILANKTGCFYDNCKVQASDINVSSLTTVLKEFAQKTTKQHALNCWNEAVVRTHQAAVDGLIADSISGYCIATFRDLLNKAA